MQQNEKIGFIGVGLMGHGMAKNILRAGYPVTVIAHKNRVPVENLLSLGAQEAGSLESAGQRLNAGIHLCPRFASGRTDYRGTHP